MALPSPNLDDRNFDQLLGEAKARFSQFSQSTIEWTDLTPSDPGIILLELFAHLTEIMIYRLNRVPQKVYVEFLRLLGARLEPPAAASVTLEFSRAKITEQPMNIPIGTTVTLGRAGGGGAVPVFVTMNPGLIPTGEAKTQVRAYHCEQIQAEFVGTGTGLPGLTVTVKHPPIVAPMEDKNELIVGVEAAPAEVETRAKTITYDGKTYNIWREAENFSDVEPDAHVFIVDRATGAIFFAPALRAEQDPEQQPHALTDTPKRLAAAPPVGNQIRVWYRRGGGAEGNVAPGVLTTVKNLPGVEVTNPLPASGGRAMETLDNALIRGPQHFRSLQRVLTAGDFETVSRTSSSAIKRAKAYAKAEVWKYAERGTVEVLLVPGVPDNERVTLEKIRTYQTPETLEQVRKALDGRRPLGITCNVNWVRLKTVHVTANVRVRMEENPDDVKKRLIDHLHQKISPLNWQFGQSLRASDVYDIALKEPGVRNIDPPRLVVDEAPDKATFAIATDPLQPRTWYAGSDSTLFRSSNDGLGWEAVWRFPDEEEIRGVEGCAPRPGLVAVTTRVKGTTRSHVVVSHDCGETWEMPGWFISVEDIAWTLRDNRPLLLLATQTGVFELDPDAGTGPVPIKVAQGLPDTKGFYSIVAYTDTAGIVNVAVAAYDNGGVYLSSDGGMSNTFHQAAVPNSAIPSLAGHDIRRLAIQSDGLRAYLWAGAIVPDAVGATAERTDGDGCWRWELRGKAFPPDGWNAFSAGWTGGSCLGMAFQDSKILAASRWAGVLALDPTSKPPTWRRSDPVKSGLPTETASPQRTTAGFQRVETVAASLSGDRLILAGGAEGVFISRDGSETYTRGSNRETSDNVTLPDNWLFVSGEHDIQVSEDNEAS